ncbi:hypothetical protein HNP24_001275 [Chryseobacterium sediminis]|uniref:YD repeat-containing protein n=1 Tax=Chryseobacterium sediminis TaxID=1679494 RepID=A0ABR6PX78_9FLAO|nr:hypothetical protein [Chryseobacterium sediminis]MBB6330325.1 hypothetical protein [Chryseobacterium sediminis]
MKKTIISLAILIAGMGQFYAQQQQVNFGDSSRPVPSVSSLATYANTPVSNATGLPDISFPLLGLPTYNSGMSLNVGLSYNPMNASQSEPASQTGTGWTVFAGGVISRSIELDIDEMYDDPSGGNYVKNNFNDIYYYNLPGVSGKFKFKRNLTNNTFELINLSSNKIKIEYTRTSNTATLILDSFTITDTNGTKYFFNDYSRSNQERNAYSLGGKVYRSAFFLSQIKDANNVELANFTYQKNIKYKNGSSTLIYETCKLKTITSPGFGKIELEYLYDSFLEGSMNDPYQLQKISLKDNYNHMISGYGFEYLGNPLRTLMKLKKLDKNESVSETTEFEYGASAAPQSPGMSPHDLCDQSTLPTLPKTAYGVLKRIISPAKGVVEYNFEPNQYYKDKNEPSYANSIVSGNSFIDPELQYFSPFKDILYNTTKPIPNYPFTVSGTTPTKKVFIVFGVEEFYPVPPYWDTNTPPKVDYVIYNSGGTAISGTQCYSYQYYSVREYDLPPGNYVLGVTGSGGRGQANLFGMEHVAQPFPNRVTGNGIRIASINYYNSKTETTPVKSTRFDYSSFSDSQASSGVLFNPELDVNAEKYPLYKNVKIMESDNSNGHVKYYYKTPDDYPKTIDSWPYYSLTSGGLLDKKEVYNAQNKLLVLEQNNYTFEEIFGLEDYQLWSNNTLNSKPGWLKKSTVTSTSYFDNGQSIEEQSETNFNAFNFGVISTKKVVDGNTTEQFYTYPETGYTNLSNAHILDAPVIAEEKNDGKTASKAETKYDNTGSTLPTSVVATNISDGTTKTTMKFDLYNEEGNLLQLTSSVGIPTAIVYGYDKTQPIARIEGATYAQVSPYIQAIVDASNSDAQNPDTEPALLLALDNFRKTTELKDFQITTMTYDPLIGMTTTTPPSGIRAIYRYNANNQLEKIVTIVNNQEVTLKEYQYHYKN